ncbi:bifunctional proline dehydrogenase/L-glutamate gamma-semialdehyde dehydrogenase [Gordonia alkaliphila]|uniref:proline dehydrogenase family protein n=1 Tax=Gordonia alkaliphila TaxID=1053547 RepID=UPI001FF6838F|nr:bifunctional proline dehydrogenase/L-glutamate gamma-semialdehyde dehydrogenase [Gordonia alkaliphila]MCK0440045.1 bifunctional proline dehydrogenase/L-glutamate gamma-semialdehyde dehydrogenase [Gordonia alkaliphila]
MGPQPPRGRSDVRTELDELAADSRALVEHWLAVTAASATRPDPAAARLVAVLADPRGLAFTVGFVDRVIGVEDIRAAALALTELTADLPSSLRAVDRLQLRLGGRLAPHLPRLVVSAARLRMRSMVGHLIVDARPRRFARQVARLRRDGHRLNVNPLGEAVLGETEAARRLSGARRLLRRDDVDYVSVKVSAVTSQLSMWDFDATAAAVTDRLAPMYREAAAAPPGTAFLNLDMEEYRDLRLTVEVFTRLLSLPELRRYEAGIVLQAYLPDALGVMEELARFGAQRVADGGAGIKVRLVKGANLAMERVHAELAGWPSATYESKLATDVNYKRVLHAILTPETLTGLRVGVAGHNLFDVAFAQLLAHRRGVADRVEFEMLAGMATAHSRAVAATVGPLLLYVPTVAPKEFDVAISYLVRRLEENASSDNFLSATVDLRPGSPGARREADRFDAAVAALADELDRGPLSPPEPRRRQDRRRITADTADLPELPPFTHTPDTDPALPANQAWAREVLATSARPGWLDAAPAPPAVSAAAIDDLVARARTAAVAWAARPARDRARVLDRAADLLEQRRGLLVALAAAEVGKTIGESDPEVSEAVDFARYYARRALDLDPERLDPEHVATDDAVFTPDRLVVVTPPWNFPNAIAAGGMLAALAVGAAVIAKPAGPSPRCLQAIAEALWEAGVPRAVCATVAPDEGEAGRRLIAHPGVDRVILTGASDTAALFASWRPELALTAETSGKNALVITPSADRDRAIADLVHSAFGHAGQKCSAASLAILVGSMATSERFRRQLVDAASSLIVDWPTNLSATVGPLTEPPGAKLTRALTVLDPGERWLLRPRALDDSGRLFSPGIKVGVARDSSFHRTEVFGPVLGLMAATDLDDALDLQNGTDFGLTAGLHSRDPVEVRTWLDRVQAGNLYVNRGITGAVVGRQPFGGWKLSSVGSGAKAGGPNYLRQLGTWSDAARHSRNPAPRALPPGPIADFVDAVAPLLDAPSHAWLRAAAGSDEDAWSTEFGRARELTGLAAEANIFRYRRADTAVRVGTDADPARLARVLAAAARARIRPALSLAEPVPVAVDDVLRAARAHLDVGPVVHAADDRFTAAVSASGPARIRVIGTVSAATRAAVAARPATALLDDPVVAAGAVELRYWVLEQAVSITLHRFGDPDGFLQQVAAELLPSAGGSPRPRPSRHHPA